MADNVPSLPQFHSGFKGIPTPDQLGMNMNPYKAAGLLRKVGNSINKPLKVSRSTGSGTRGISKAGRAATTGSRSTGGGRQSGGGKK
jgi:hypothetical protein